MSQSVHAKVLRTHPGYTAHPGEIITLTRAEFDKYAESGPFFEESSAKEAAAAHAQTETATAPAAAETAVVPATGVKTSADVAKTLEKGVEKAAKTAHKGTETGSKAAAK
ncbi:hypothetical protein ACVWYF_004153 [Hymenobacter sp. UYAg731]